MKNIFKFLGIALVAGSLMVACGDKEEGEDNNVPTYTITTEVNSAVMGSVTGGGQYKEGETCTLNAIANEGHRFVKWQDDNTNNPRVFTVTEDATYTATFEVETGVKVTFGDVTWNAAYVNGQLYSNAIMLAAGQTSSTSYPIIKLTNIATPATGTFTGGSSLNTSTGAVSMSNTYVWYFETVGDEIELEYQSGETEDAGDWWSNNITLNITAFDADAMTVSMVANASMSHVAEAFEGVAFADMTTRDLTVNVVNQSLTTGSKGILKNMTATVAVK